MRISRDQMKNEKSSPDDPDDPFERRELELELEKPYKITFNN